MTTVYLDIETIPSQLPWVKDYIIDTIKPPGTIKKQESLDAWYAEKMPEAVEEAMLKTSFDGAMSHILAIGFALGDEPVQCLYSPNPVSIFQDGEAVILDTFFRTVEKISYPNFVGHNISEFDLKLLRQRAIILNVDVARNIPFSAKPWDMNPFDTMVQWDAKNKISLDKLATAMRLGGKNDMDGSKVYDYWQKGKHDEIIEYCKKDVDLVRDVYKRFNVLGGGL
jgi:predicted PolB exonuclease-like 3'-5' exonuclease